MKRVSFLKEFPHHCQGCIIDRYEPFKFLIFNFFWHIYADFVSLNDFECLLHDSMTVGCHFILL